MDRPTRKGGASRKYGIAPLDPQFAVVLGLLLERSSALVGLKDLDGAYVFANRELEEVLGVERGELVGRKDESLMPAEAAAGIAARERQAAAADAPVRAEEQIVGKRSILSCVTVRFPYRNETGGIVGTGFVAIDIGERRAREADTLDALRRAEQTVDDLRGALEELKARVSIDKLTGALTRARIEESAQQEMARFARYSHPVTLMLIDLDRFKRINDTYGHLAGDEVLRGFCDCVRESMRTTDLLGRWGGEEFVLLCPNTTLAAARVLAGRIRGALAARSFPGLGPVTASVGVAEHLEEESWNDWLARADAALYRAKEGGRDRVEVDLESAVSRSGEGFPDGGLVKLVWRKDYESGHRGIDRQHRALFRHANRLIAAMVAGRREGELIGLMDGMLHEIKQHFRDEEELLRACGYEDADAHARSHAGLLEQASRLAGDLARGELRFERLLHFIAYEVVARHILPEDRKYFAALAASGL